QGSIGNPFVKGDILTKNGIHYTRLGDNPRSVQERDIDAFPEVFEKMDWHEEREIEDMPEYVKYNDDDGIYKVERWNDCNVFRIRTPLRTLIEFAWNC